MSITYSLNIFAFNMQKLDFSNKPKLHKRRHILKAITWRIVGTADTWIISWLLLNYISDIHFFNITLDNNV